MAPHSSTLAWKIPWMEEPGGLQSMGVTKSQTQLSDFPFTFHFHTLEKGMAAHSSVLAWRIPGTGEPGGLLSMGSHRVGHDWSDLAAVASTHLYDIFPDSDGNPKLVLSLFLSISLYFQLLIYFFLSSSYLLFIILIAMWINVCIRKWESFGNKAFP